MLKDGLTAPEKKLQSAEVHALSRITPHENLIGFRDSGRATLKSADASESQVDFLALDLAAGGELFDKISREGPLQEAEARGLFRQLLAGVSHCHDNGFVHRDIKLENIILDEHEGLKIIDFGFATETKPDLVEKMGTKPYMAPELHFNNAYNGKPADIFAAGVSLFVMVFAKHPFDHTKSSGVMYKTLQHQPKIFWKHHSQQNPSVVLSDQLKELITSMLKLNPEERPSIK